MSTKDTYLRLYDVITYRFIYIVLKIFINRNSVIKIKIKGQNFSTYVYTLFLESIFVNRIVINIMSLPFDCYVGYNFIPVRLKPERYISYNKSLIFLLKMISSVNVN